MKPYTTSKYTNRLLVGLCSFRVLLLCFLVSVACISGSLFRAAQAATIEAKVLENMQAGREQVVIVQLANSLQKFRLSALSIAGSREIYERQQLVLNQLPNEGWQEVYRYRHLSALTLTASPQVVEKLAENPNVLRIGADARIFGQAAETVPFVGASDFRNQYGIGGENVTVAIFDSGINTTHPDFSGRIIAGGSFLNESGFVAGAIADDHGHGTNVAGILAAAGTIAPTGMAPKAKLLIFKVLDSDNSGWVSDWAAAADYVAEHIEDWPELRVSNSSLQSWDLFSSCPCGDEFSWSQVARDAYDNLEEAGVINFACTGNFGGRGKMALPACFSSTISVGAVYDQDYGRYPAQGEFSDANCHDENALPDTLACFTNIGSCLDLLAPGVEVYSTDIYGSAGLWFTGTSQATPIAAGAAALLISLKPQATNEEIVQAMTESGVNVELPSEPNEAPRVDVMAAAEWLGIQSTCGNGELEEGEICDDGNRDDSDCCLANCRTAQSYGVSCDDGDPQTASSICDGEGHCVEGTPTQGGDEDFEPPNQYVIPDGDDTTDGDTRIPDGPDSGCRNSGTPSGIWLLFSLLGLSIIRRQRRNNGGHHHVG